MTVLPLCPFPPAAWFGHLLSPETVVDVWEHYPKQTLRNRFLIAAANGTLSLTVPVEGQKGRKVPVKDIRLSEDNGWKKLHVRSIRSAYGRSAFFPHLEDALEQLYSNPSHHYLVEFSLGSIEVMRSIADLPDIRLSDGYMEPTEAENDLRNSFSPESKLSSLPPYPQVFTDRHGFISGLSLLDTVMNLGPRTLDKLLMLKNE